MGESKLISYGFIFRTELALTRRLMSRMLTRIGCAVEQAENGQAALDLLLAPTSATQSTPALTPLSITDSTTPMLTVAVEPKYHIVFLDNQ